MTNHSGEEPIYLNTQQKYTIPKGYYDGNTQIIASYPHYVGNNSGTTSSNKSSSTMSFTLIADASEDFSSDAYGLIGWYIEKDDTSFNNDRILTTYCTPAVGNQGISYGYRNSSSSYGYIYEPYVEFKSKYTYYRDENNQHVFIFSAPTGYYFYGQYQLMMRWVYFNTSILT